MEEGMREQQQKQQQQQPAAAGAAEAAQAAVAVPGVVTDEKVVAMASRGVSISGLTS